MTLEQAKNWLKISSIELDKQKEYLTELDAKIGDADHGTNIARGFKEVVKAIEEKNPKTIGELFKNSAMIMMSKVGGASGMLYTAFFLKASAPIMDKEEIDGATFIEVLDAGIKGIMDRGRANVGDKTMVDVWVPSADLFKGLISDGEGFAAASLKVGAKAKEEATKTIDIIAKKGRASYLGERSIGHQDPGATSTAIILGSLAKALN